jgi:indolepyruvate ferredoxin oxidoreductase alpha subunit
MDISEEFRIPVILRPAIRVCHARQSISFGPIKGNDQKASFKKDPLRWAATPRFRLILHGELNKKLEEIRKKSEALSAHNFHNLKPGKRYPLGFIAGGVPYSVIKDILSEENRSDIPVLKIGIPYPFPERLAGEFLSACVRVLVVEETDTFIEYLLRDKDKVLGRLSGHVPAEGELVPQVIHKLINKVLKELNLEPLQSDDDHEVMELVKGLQLPVRRPTLCPGCPERAAFFAIRKTKPKAIFTSDIGCYTLGLNLGAVDTCLDMGAAITMAAGFYHSFAQDAVEQPIVATIGDSTFFHAGTVGLLNAVYNNARFILVILDNQTTAMTGMQPTPALGIRADGSEGRAISLERIVAGCGVDFIEVVDPYDIKKMTSAIKKATAHMNGPEGGIAVIIARHPCIIAYPDTAIKEKKRVTVTDDCVECNFCLERFECPALYHDQELGRVNINREICVDCGVCIEICPKGAIVEA